MINEILANELVSNIIRLFIFLIPFIWCGFHFKKYGFIQGFFSLLCIPMMYLFIIEIFINLDLKLDVNILKIVIGSKELFSPYFNLHKEIYLLTKINWLYNTNWIFMPSIVLYFLTLGYSITAYQNKKKKLKND